MLDGAAKYLADVLGASVSQRSTSSLASSLTAVIELVLARRQTRSRLS